MSVDEKRKTQRVSCEIPLSMPCTGTQWLAKAVDISCTGLRILVPPAAIGLDADVTLLEVARHLAGVLPRHTSVQIDPSRLGSLVKRPIEVVRIGLREGDDPQVEFGCRLEIPLTLEDLAAVGVSAVVLDGLRPKAKEPHPVADPPARRTHPATPPGPGSPSEGPIDLQSGLTPVADAPIGPMRALLIPTNGSDAEPMHVWTRALTHERVVLLMPDLSVLGLGSDVAGVSDLLVPILDRLGEECRLRVAKGATHIWSVPVRLQAVGRMSGDPNALILEMAFGRALRGPELRALETS